MQRLAQLVVDRRVRMLLEDPLDERLIVERGRRDRGVGVRSKTTGIEP
jgi:hypothetical protein